MTTCTQIGCTWTGTQKAHCGAGGCHRTFTGITTFDAHLTRDSGPNGRFCVDDLTQLGLVLRSQPEEPELWGLPEMTEQERATLAQAFGRTGPLTPRREPQTDEQPLPGVLGWVS